MEEQIFEYDPQLTLGYVIRCYEPFSGEVYYRPKGTRLLTAENKDSFMIEETYTFKGAKKAIANLQRYGGNSEDHTQYSIERLSCYEYHSTQETSLSKKRAEAAYETACRRIIELKEKHDFDNGDLMRLGEIRDALMILRDALHKRK